MRIVRSACIQGQPYGVWPPRLQRTRSDTSYGTGSHSAAQFPTFWKSSTTPLMFSADMWPILAAVVSACTCVIATRVLRRRAVAAAMHVLSVDRNRKVNFGHAARAHALVHYRTGHLNAALISYFDRLLREFGRIGVLTDSATYQNYVDVRVSVAKP